MLLIILVIVGLSSMGHTRHIHPGSIIKDQVIFEDLYVDENAPIDVIYFKPNRFVPINSDSFFKTYELCQDGFKRDALGVCREVWD